MEREKKMSRDFSFNPRVAAVILLVLTVVVFACLVLYSYGDGVFSNLAVATRTARSQQEIIASVTSQVSTASVDATNAAATLTQSAVPPATFTPTQPPTFTPPPELSSCNLALKQGALIYQDPSKGSPSSDPSEENVVAIAEAKNIGWVKIQPVNEKFLWVPKDNLLQSNDCFPKVVDLAYLTGWSLSQNLVFQEDFSSINRWMDSQGEFAEVLVSKGIPALILNPNDVVTLEADPSLGYMENFSMYLSFYREANGYLGVRFWNDGANYYEVHVTYNCDFELYDQTGELILPLRNAGEADCLKDSTNFLSIVINGKELSLSLNSMTPIDFPIKPIDKGDLFSFTTSGSKIKLEYLVITKP